MARKNPTMMEMMKVVSNVISQLEETTGKLNELDRCFGFYLDFNGHKKEFVSYLDKERNAAIKQWKEQEAKFKKELEEKEEKAKKKEE